ncbi:hypothetical protein F5Y19DRAFT_439421 [Xylariaceae sp. FL1651]|nr:hypothetical protein F5Y19DRAFT_439421 [Xylariaceae sp. FL1651]
MVSNEGGFEFVAQESNGTLSREDRSKVRRHVMRTVKATQQRNSEATLTYYAAHYSLPSMPLSGLELLVRDSGLDPIDLSALSSIHLGAVALAAIQSEPSQLRHVLLCRQRSYFSFIPSRFGHALALDDAFRCLINAVHSYLIPHHKRSDNIILRYYGKALRSLQSAVNDSIQRYAAETLCAASILALFELFNSANGDRLWSNHLSGVCRLIQLRGAARFTSDFEKALLLQLVYPLSVEALFQNSECFFDHQVWMDVFKELVDPLEIFTDRSLLGINLAMFMVRIPGLARRNTCAVNKQLEQHDIEALETSLRGLRSKITEWRRDFNTALIHATDIGADTCAENQNSNTDKRYELLGISLVIHILVSRMLVCIVPDGRALLENEVQDRALELKQVHQSVRKGNNNYNHKLYHYRAEFFLTQKVKIADAAIATHLDFLSAAESGHIVEPWMLKKFCTELGRQC